MIELLMAAFVMALGLLALAMLQVMSLRTARGGKNLTTAVQLAERILDQVEMEGRLSWLNLTDSSYTSPSALPQLQYVGHGTTYLGFDADGKAVSTAPVTSKPSAFYVATTTESAVSTASTGSLSDYTVMVEFSEVVDSASIVVTRSVTVVRRVLHG